MSAAELTAVRDELSKIFSKHKGKGKSST